jgi:7-carboxy-7-deazaguanine synthase (Cx14CxxC type)
MPYAVKEIFHTLQGEGAQAGRSAVFCRFAGCNLWSGRAADRANAICKFCDTDFVGTDGPGGGQFASAEDLAAAIARAWPASSGNPLASRERERAIKPGNAAADSGRFVVLTGGEPLLQVDAALIDALHKAGFEIAVETNGTQPAPRGLDWVCVSPKAGAKLVQQSGDELKLVYPQADLDPAQFEILEFRHFFLQPLDSPYQAANTQAALEYCLAHPKWRLSLQLHKILQIP